MRRRILNTGITVLPVTLSSYSYYSATPVSGTTTVTAYYGGVKITDLTTSMITKGGNMSSVSVSSSGVITMNYYRNTSTSSTKSSTMTLTYQGQSVTFTITQAKDYETGRTEMSKVSSTTYEMGTPAVRTMVLNYYKTNCNFRNSLGIYARVYNFKTNVTTCYYDRITYASGNVVDSSCKRSETNTTTDSDKWFAVSTKTFSNSELTVGTTYNLS